MAAVPSKSNQLNIQISQAKKLHRDGKLEAAKQSYEKLLRKHPGNVTLLALIGGVCLQTKNYKEALDSGDTETIKQLLEVFNNATGDGATTPPAPERRDTSHLEPVGGRGSRVALGEPDASDEEAAFREALKVV